MTKYFHKCHEYHPRFPGYVDISVFSSLCSGIPYFQGYPEISFCELYFWSMYLVHLMLFTQDFLPFINLTMQGIFMPALFCFISLKYSSLSNVLLMLVIASCILMWVVCRITNFFHGFSVCINFLRVRELLNFSASWLSFWLNHGHHTQMWRSYLQLCRCFRVFHIFDYPTVIILRPGLWANLWTYLFIDLLRAFDAEVLIQFLL